MSDHNQKPNQSQNKPTVITEGMIKRGGVAPKPTQPRPPVKPVSQKKGN